MTSPDPDPARAVELVLHYDKTLGQAARILGCGVRSVLHGDPLAPTLFVFFNKPRNKIKILYWDNDGDLPSRRKCAIWYKRLEKGTFRLMLPESGETSVTLTRAQLAMLLEGIDFQHVKQRKRFSKKSA